MKKIIALLACLALLLSMAACGTSNPETTDPADNNIKVTDPTDEVTDPTTDEIVETPDEPATTEGTVGETLLATFKANSSATAQEIADLVISNPIIQFMPATMPMEAGYLSGFDNEITGFEECVMFGPMIGTIPFIGYVFTLAEGADVEAFKTTLSENANLRWNICTAAEEMIVESEGNTVFFLMCPASFEQPEVEGDVGGMDMLPEEGEGITLG
jgi:predicted small lipoprotein YifL